MHLHYNLNRDSVRGEVSPVVKSTIEQVLLQDQNPLSISIEYEGHLSGLCTENMKGTVFFDYTKVRSASEFDIGEGFNTIIKGNLSHLSRVRGFVLVDGNVNDFISGVNGETGVVVVLGSVGSHMEQIASKFGNVYALGGNAHLPDYNTPQTVRPREHAAGVRAFRPVIVPNLRDYFNMDEIYGELEKGIDPKLRERFKAVADMMRG